MSRPPRPLRPQRSGHVTAVQRVFRALGVAGELFNINYVIDTYPMWRLLLITAATQPLALPLLCACPLVLAVAHALCPALALGLALGHALALALTRARALALAFAPPLALARALALPLLLHLLFLWPMRVGVPLRALAHTHAIAMRVPSHFIIEVALHYQLVVAQHVPG